MLMRGCEILEKNKSFMIGNLLNVDIAAPQVGFCMLLHNPSALRYLPDLQATLDIHDGHTFRISVLDVSIIGKNLSTSSALKSYLIGEKTKR